MTEKWIAVLGKRGVGSLVGDTVRGAGPFDVCVANYDVQCFLDGDEPFEAEECRRNAHIDVLVDPYATEVGFDLPALRDAVATTDDIDDEIAPVAWGGARTIAGRTTKRFPSKTLK